MFHETHNLAGYLEGALGPQAAARVERHLETCVRCRTALADMRVAQRTLTAAGEAVKPNHYDSELWSRVHAQIATPHHQAPLRLRWALAGGGLVLSAAAIGLVMMNLPHPNNHSTGAPMLTVAPPATHKHILVAKAQPGTPKAFERSVPKFKPFEVPRPEHPMSSPATPGGEPIKRESTPMPAIVPLAVPAPVVKSEKTLMANANAGQANVPFGASGNFQSHGGSMGGVEQKPLGRATYATKDAMKLDTQNAPSGTGQVTPPGQNHATHDNTSSIYAAAPHVDDSKNNRRIGGLDIVSEDAPPVPKTLGLAGQVNERGLMSKGKGPQPVQAPRFGLSPVREAVPRLGLSTIEGHRQYAEADNAFRAGNDSAANFYYSDAIKHGLDSYESRVSEVRLGDLAMKSNDAATAVRWYRAAVVRSKDAEVLSKLGDALERNGDAKGAAAAYRQAMALNPAFPTAKEGLARVQGK